MDAVRRERRHHRKAAVAAAAPSAAGVGVGGGGGPAAGAAYGDVFGGPPRFAAPFGAAPMDYADVFGGVAAACSIPYLDLPPAPAFGPGEDGGFFACRGKGDYGEIFARFDLADFALPYEDLFGGPGPEREPEVASSSSSSSTSGSSRSSIRKESSQLEDEPPILPQYYQNLDHHQHFKDHRFSPMSFSPDTESQQFVMSYNKTTERRPDDVIELMTCTVEPSMDFVIDSRNLSHGPATNHVSINDNGTMANDNTYNDKNASSASVSMRSPESDFVVDQMQQSPAWTPVSGSTAAKENHKNSDSHSTHGTVTPPDYSFLRVSDIDGQTQQILRQQPKLLNKKESASKGSINLVKHSVTPTSAAHATSSSNMHHTGKKADANPISASAAMKEAMDLAETRLKAAKELLERKGDSFKLRKKPSHHRNTRSTEIKPSVSLEADTSEQTLSVKTSSKEEKNPDDSLSAKHKTLSAVGSDHFDDNGKRVPPLEKPQQMMQHSAESWQTQASRKLDKLGNWKSGNDFFELSRDDQKFKTSEAMEEGDKCERMNPITSLISGHGETEFSAADSDLDRYEKLWEVNDGRDVEVKHVNLREDKMAPVDKDRESVILEASTENMAHQKAHNSISEGLVTQENAREIHDTDECLGLPSTSGTSRKLDVLKDMSGSLPEACSSRNASDLRDLANSSPKESLLAGTSQENTNSKLVPEVPLDGGMQCTSGNSEKIQEPSDVSNVTVSQGSNIKSLILEELKGSDVLGPSRIEQEAETYGREKFSFIDGSLLHNQGTKINEVPSEGADKVETEEKAGSCACTVDTDVDLDAECPEDADDVILQNNNLADPPEESNMQNVFEVASKLIKRELDQEMHVPLGRGEVEEGTDGFVSDVDGKEADETPLENSERTCTEEGSDHCNREDQKSSESTHRGQSDIDAKCDTTCDEFGSESFSGDEVIIKDASDDTARTTINSKDDLVPSSEMYTDMQHSVQKGDTATSQTSESVPGLEETGNVCDRERELPTERLTCEENIRESKTEEKDTTKISKAEHGSAPSETTCGQPKSAEEGPTPVSAQTWKKEAPGAPRARERENMTRVDSTSDKDKWSSRRAQAKESERRLEKERELAEDKDRRKLEEEERERERKKDRLAVERATREAHERAFAEAREKAEKMALDRITAARQRASAEAREKEVRASAEAAAERTAREARIKAERAAVERATAEARERAIEKAKAEKALAEARERRERYRSSFKESSKSTNQDIRQDLQRASSSNFIRNPDSGNRGVEGESALRHKARLERHQRTTERVTKALAEKNMRDLLAQREQAEKHRLSEFLDPEIKRWSNGKEGNLRALLSTLQYILGADSGWQPVPLTDLITAVAVKKAYRKATLCVHPDKLQQRGATIRQKYICEKVFDLLKDAWNKFTSEER